MDDATQPGRDPQARRSALQALAGHIPDRLGIGQPTLLNERVAETVCNHIRLRGTLESACALAGVSVTAHYKWLREARELGERLRAADENDDEERLASIWDNATEHQRSTVSYLGAYLHARAEGERWALERVREGVETAYQEGTGKITRHGDWRAAAWLLERSDPKAWGAKPELRLASEATEGETRRVELVRREGARGARVIDVDDEKSADAKE